MAQQNGGVNKFNYPAAPTSDQTDDYHGTRVADPYRPLEDPDSAPTRAWIEAENKLTFAYLEQIPAREKIRARLKELLNYERFSVPGEEGRAVLLLAQQRIAKPERAVLAARAGCGAEGIAGPERAFRRRHGVGQRVRL